MRLFVTGGSGLVGGNLIRLAAREGAEIFAALHRRSLPPTSPSPRPGPTQLTTRLPKQPFGPSDPTFELAGRSLECLAQPFSWSRWCAGSG